jgi:hypothetical protein
MTAPLDPKLIESLRGRHPGADLIEASAADIAMLFRSPDRFRWRQYRNLAGKGAEAEDTLADSCLLHPTPAEWHNLLEEYPGVVSQVVRLLETAGGLGPVNGVEIGEAPECDALGAPWDAIKAAARADFPRVRFYEAADTVIGPLLYRSMTRDEHRAARSRVGTVSEAEDGAVGLGLNQKPLVLLPAASDFKVSVLKKPGIVTSLTIAIENASSTPDRLLVEKR